MINFNQEYFANNCYFFLKEGNDKISLYYSVGDTITETRKKDDKKVFSKKNEKKLKKYISKVVSSKEKKTKDDIENDLEDIENDGEIEELVDADGTFNSSRIPPLNMYLTPRKTMDQTVPMARVSNDPVTRGYRVYWGESEEKDDNLVSEVDYSDAFGYDETEDKDFKGTVKTLKKMGVENPIERAKQFGKLPKAKRKNGKLKQRLSEKEAIEEAQRIQMQKMVEDILTKKYNDKSEVVEKEKEEKGISQFLMKNLQSIKNLAKKEGVSLSQLIKKLKTDE
jgi:hypothetical protein